MKQFEFKEKVKVNAKYLDKFDYFTWPDKVLFWWTNTDKKYHVVLWHGCLHRVSDEDIFHINDIIPNR